LRPTGTYLERGPFSRLASFVKRISFLRSASFFQETLAHCLPPSLNPFRDNFRVAYIHE